MHDSWKLIGGQNHYLSSQSSVLALPHNRIHRIIVLTNDYPNDDADDDNDDHNDDDHDKYDGEYSAGFYSDTNRRQDIK